MNLVNVKDAFLKGLRTRVVYKFSCVSCSACYVGETSRHFRTRVREHLFSDRSSHLFRRLQSSESCRTSNSPDEFYKTFWKDISSLLVSALNYAFKSGCLSITQRLGIIKLIPKKGCGTLLYKKLAPYNSPQYGLQDRCKSSCKSHQISTPQSYQQRSNRVHEGQIYWRKRPAYRLHHPIRRREKHSWVITFYRL